MYTFLDYRRSSAFFFFFSTHVRDKRWSSVLFCFVLEARQGHVYFPRLEMELCFQGDGGSAMPLFLFLFSCPCSEEHQRSWRLP